MGAEGCTLTRLQSCEDTNQLVWDKAFEAAVRRFLRDRRADYLYHGYTVAHQRLTVLSGPPDPPQRIGELFRFTACREHSCDEKGAAVLEPDGRLVALGIFHAACEARPPAPDCYAHFTLTLFVRDPARQQLVIDNLSKWAKAEADADSFGPDLAKPRLDRVEVIRMP